MSGTHSKIPVVTIDGPAGGGKSTVARRVADLLGFDFLDTGAMYRAATWRALHQAVDLRDHQALAVCTQSMKLEMRDGRVRVDGIDVTEAIRTPEVTRNIRFLDGIPAVREHLGGLQRALGASRPTVAEGRDMGTVVFPDAACKIFLDASLEERALRRKRELERSGTLATLEAVIEDIRQRDQNDTTRAVAPLRTAEGAHRIDTTTLGVEEVANLIAALAREAIGEA